MQEKVEYLQQAATGRNHFIVYIATLVGVIIAFYLGQIPISLLIGFKVQSGDINNDALIEFQESLDFDLLQIDPTLGLSLFLISFVVGLLAFIGLFRWLHQRPFLTIITSGKQVDYRKLFWGFGVWFALLIGIDLINWSLGVSSYLFQFSWSTFLPLLLVSIILFPIQTSMEEVLFRGYLLQGIGLGTKSRWIALILTSLAFGLMHSFNPEVKEYGFGLMMIFYVSMGLFLGICTLMDGGLELALGIHAANNIYGATIVTFTGSALQTPALFKMDGFNGPIALLLTLIAIGIFIFVVSKKYSWSGWNKLWQPILIEREITNDI